VGRTILCGGSIMLQIWTRLINWCYLWEWIMCSTQTPRLGGSNETIIPHWLGDEGLGCLYGTKDTYFIARRLLRNKTHRKPCGIIFCGGPIMLRIWTHFISWCRPWKRVMCSTQAPRLGFWWGHYPTMVRRMIDRWYRFPLLIKQNFKD